MTVVDAPADLRTLAAGSLLLEPLVPAHADAMFEVLGDPQLYRYLDYGPPPSLAHVRGVYAKLARRRSPDGAEQWLNWVMRVQGRLVGYVQSTVMANGDAWVAYFLRHDAQGRGHATVATHCMMAHLVEAYGARRFLATVECDHLRSIALLSRLGFAEATAVQAAQHELTPTERLFVAPAGVRGASPASSGSSASRPAS